jgi:hypothetical protein
LVDKLEYQGERSELRHTVDVEITLAVGLSACHHFISAEMAFLPEDQEQEIDAINERGVGELNGKKDEDFLYLAKNINDNINEVQVGGYYGDTLASMFTTEDWFQKDESENGLSLVNKRNKRTQVRVGTLIAYKKSESGNSHYYLGIVCWLRMSAKKGITLGIMNLSDHTCAVASKAISKLAKGSEYARSLLILVGDREHRKASLITPAGLYSEGDTLCLNNDGHIRHIRVDSMLKASSNFTHFEFSLVHEK